jgi:GH35 family endo-1,4-beta-xylanase
LINSSSQSARLTIVKIDAGGTNYTQVATGTANSNSWTQLVGTYTFNPNGTLTTLTLYVEGPSPSVSFYADDFIVELYNDWRSAANARIEQIRKRDVRVLIVDGSSNPVPGTALEVQQTKHRFAFGSAINGNISNPNYASFFKTNFQWAVMENESKWYSNEPSRSNVTYTAANNITNFCHANGIILRGHTIFWAVDTYVQNWVKALNDADLLVHLTNRLNSAVNHFKGTFVHWDVNNEMLHGNYFGNRHGNWINSWMFKHARSLDTNVLLFVNDYNVVSGNETEAYKQQILALIASNAPVGGIGAQGHFGSTINPSTTEARIDSLAELGLPIWISEYDSVNSNQFVRADNLETLYRIAFSKPSVDGVLMWGFWAGSHWRGSNAAIVDLSWGLNAAGHRYQSLLSEWTTVTNGTANAQGAFDFRGFHGTYEVTVTPTAGQPTVHQFTLNPGADTNVVTLIVQPPNAPALDNVGLTSGGNQLRFLLSGDTGRSYAIEASLDLSFSNWTTISTAFNASGTVWITNPIGLPTQQFYRARLLP